MTMSETMTATPPTTTLDPAPPLKRCAIIGTAESWNQCPWGDATLEVWGLNDAYLIGVPRADRWYDLHPFHQMVFRPPGGRGSSGPQPTVPAGAYLRPAGHLEWLKTRPMPVFLAEGRPDYPSSQTFPKDALLDWFQRYWPLRRSRRGTIGPGPDYEVSTPAWMLMHALAEGYGEIHVYGIHLATDWERQAQRHNFEFLLGIASGRGVKLVLPEATPICRSSYRYAFEPKADIPVQIAQAQMIAIKTRGAALHQQIAALPWYAHQRRAALTMQLRTLDVELADTRQIAQRASLALETV